ncbi:HAD-IA family hydrolase [Anaerotalea alkaliphila]|uniref:HAD-IA family hydrolase n=1 Tax=Anaerotalea alkaliphila TaxID=2662126 RepID=A0A7X5HXE0_9FIRM|nr:HAD-IA family hydrolase [Anaerotalea alkaliphila]NDL68246.1 HAD-IA family hydrolase [Anaerotalea alkaliphila]
MAVQGIIFGLDGVMVSMREPLGKLSPDDILPGVMALLARLKSRRVKLAVASSGKDMQFVLKRIGLEHFFDAVVDGSGIREGEPDPEVYLEAANKLGLLPEGCLVVEAGDAGVEAAVAGGMKVLAVGSAWENPKADYRSRALRSVDLDLILK